MSTTTPSNLHQLTDSELVSAYKDTENKIYVGELYKRYAHLVLGMCIQYFKDKDVAKDITLEIFEKLFVELKKREVESFKAWLSFVVRNYCISTLRKQQTEQSRREEFQVVQAIDALPEEQEFVPEQKIEELKTALDHLNPFQRKCIELFYYHDKSYAQIVELTGFTANEVKSYIQNGKRNLKLILTESN